MPVTPTIEVDDTLKERSSHGSFELPIETYTDNCEIFHSLYNHWHDEMELIYIESGSGLVRLNKEILRVKAGDLIIVNRGVLHGIKTDLKNIDVLVDGKFKKELRDEELYFRGSRNQRLIDVQTSLQKGETVIYHYNPKKGI